MTPKYVVTDKGPLDRHVPGEDVTGLYDPVTLARLVKDGYLRRVHGADAVDQEATSANAPTNVPGGDAVTRRPDPSWAEWGPYEQRQRLADEEGDEDTQEGDGE